MLDPVLRNPPRRRSTQLRRSTGVAAGGTATTGGALTALGAAAGGATSAGGFFLKKLNIEGRTGRTEWRGKGNREDQPRKVIIMGSGALAQSVRATES